MTSHSPVIPKRTIFTITLLSCVVCLALWSASVGTVMAQENSALSGITTEALSQQARLVANDGTAGDNFGNAVAISGNTAIVGANRQSAQNDHGAAYVYVRNGAAWSQQQKLLPGDIINGDTFGAAVAIDGDTIVVSAPIHRVGVINGQGAVYVFVRNGTNWTQQQQLFADDGALNDQFGTSVAISGNTVMVGSWMDTVGPNSRQGSVYVFTRNGTTWTQQQKLTASDGIANDQLGASIAMTGTTMVVGGLQNNFGASRNGVAYVFTLNGATWVQQQKLVAADGSPLDAFGNSVAISSTSDTIAVGAFRDDEGPATDRGAVYVFALVGGVWSQQQKLQGSLGINNGFGNEFGTAVAVDGNTVIAGAPSVNFVAGGGRGGIYEFDRAGTTWTETDRANPTTVISNFGCSLSLNNGSLVAGASTDMVGANLGQGAAYVFSGLPVTGPRIQFGASGYSVNENAGSVTITVTRIGDSTAAASVEYLTSDTDTFTVGCSNTTQNFGGAYGRCDYATSVDTINFAAGETSKTFTIPIIDDALVELDETFTVALRNPVGASLGTPSTTSVTIHDEDILGEANPIFTTPFFVRQHYLDFLSREPEQAEPWSAVLNNCSDVNNNPACDRLTVSAAFFGSPEFQLKGYFVYRFYKLAFNRIPTYLEFVTDTRAITGQTPTEVFQKKAAYANAFVQRTEFANLYAGLNNSQYVIALMGRYGLTQITTPDPAQPDGNVKVTLTTADLTNQLNAATLTRAQVLRAIADSDQVFALEFNQAFVATQYYGYLRRTPDTPGYNAWLDYLNTHPTDSRTMVNGFMNSAEYRLRFGPAQ